MWWPLAIFMGTALERLLAGLRSKYEIFEHSDPDKLRRGVALVFTGDYIDRGNSALAIIERLRRIGGASPEQLVTLLGNHELLALEAYDKATELSKRKEEGDVLAEYRDRTGHGRNGGVEFIREFGQHTLPPLKSYAARMARSGDIGGWMRALRPFFETTVARRKILFTHADLSERLRDCKVLSCYLRRLEKHQEVSTLEAGGTRAKYGHPILGGDGSIFWSRSFRRLDDADQASIDDICNRVGVDVLVTGHTPHKAIKAYGKRIFDIDVGMSPRCGGNTPQALLFSRDGIVGFGANGTETTFARW